MKIEVRDFAAGLLFGGILIGIAWAGSVWWMARTGRSPEEAAMYDACLISQAGKTVACDALVRITRRENLKGSAKKLLEVGFTKREVFDWAMKTGLGLKGSLEAAGISEEDYHNNKY